MIVAIHQPNYLPWLGYFAKIARADVFVLLDDVQFSKGSYTNRVQIARKGEAVWLTLPVQHDFGAAISQIRLARPDWARAHADVLRQSYGQAAMFKPVWREFEPQLGGVSGDLALVNGTLIKWIAGRLGLAARFLASSSLDIKESAADVRLAAIVERIAPGGTYLSGAGGAKYQEDGTFAKRGLTLAYSEFKPEPYARTGEEFIPGLSVIDALFHLGFEATAELVKARRP